MRPARITSAILLLTLALFAPCRADRSRAFEERSGAMVLEVVGGATLGLAGAWAGGFVGYQSGSCHEDDGFICGNKLAGAMLGAWIGNAIGNTLGISWAGDSFDQGGSPAIAFAAGIAGNLLSIPIAGGLSDQSPGLVLAALVVVPAITGTLGYQTGVSEHLRRMEESETAIRMREGALRLAAAPPVAGLLKDGFRADLITLHF